MFDLRRRMLVLATSLLLVASMEAQSTPEATASRIKVPEGFVVAAWASEPLVINPTAIEVDSRGRVWVAEGLNYRFFRNGEFKRLPGADRIKILEDTDGDGKADKVTVFADGIYPVPMGLAIQERWENGKYRGCRIFTGCSPGLLCLEDTDGDDRADKRSALLERFGGIDNDHGVHGMTLGIDGKLYFTQGNSPLENRDPKSPEGTTFDVVDKSGRRISMAEQGVTFRCNPDGSNLEVLGWRFRNNYECWLDSFGRAFVSDNDDDGNRGSRMLWLLEGGNYGYKIPSSIRHWAEELPGIVPKLVGTGNGSPAGILVYEGREFPREFLGSVFQVDAGVRQINWHRLQRRGAAFRTEYEVFLRGDESHFRPIDLAIAGDGSMLVADWHDAGVGGHRFTDQTTGRIFRVTPPGHHGADLSGRADLSSIAGQAAALTSSNNTLRFAARESLLSAGEKARSTLNSMFRTGDQIDRARALQVLADLPGGAAAELQLAIHDNDPEIRELAVRILRRRTLEYGVVSGAAAFNDAAWRKNLALVLGCANDVDAGVRREVLLALCQVDWSDAEQMKMATAPILEIADRWDGQDRYYLEALRLALRRMPQEDVRSIGNRWLKRAKDEGRTGAPAALPPYFPVSGNEAFLRTNEDPAVATWGSRLLGLAWALQSPMLLNHLESLSTVDNFAGCDLAVENCLAGMTDPSAGLSLLRLAASSRDIHAKRRVLMNLALRIDNRWKSLIDNEEVHQLIDSALNDPLLRIEAIRLVGKAGMKSRLSMLLQWACSQSEPVSVRTAAWEEAAKLAPADTAEMAASQLRAARLIADDAFAACIQACRGVESPALLGNLLDVVRQNSLPAGARRLALRSMAASRAGAERLLSAYQAGDINESLNDDLRFIVHEHPDSAVRELGKKLMPLDANRSQRDWSAVLRSVANKQGNAKKGSEIFHRDRADSCIRCHRVEGIGNWVGPDLSSIGIKYAGEEMLQHLTNPSAAIGFNFHAYAVACKDGRVVTGLIVDEDDERIVVKTALNERIAIAGTEIESKVQQSKSLMPDGLLDRLSDEETADLIAYLLTLRRESSAVGEFNIIELPAGGPERQRVDKAMTVDWANGKAVTAGRDGQVDLSRLAASPDAGGVLLGFTVTASESLRVRIVAAGTPPASLFVPSASVPLHFSGGDAQSSASAEIALRPGSTRFAFRVPANSGGSLAVTVVSDRAIGIAR